MIRKLMVTLAVFMMLTGTVSAAEPVLLKWATFEPAKGWSNQQVWGPWIEEVNKIAEGILQIKFYTGGTLGRDPKTYLKMVTDGVADMGWIMNPYHPGRFMDDMVCYFPFLADNALESSVAIYRVYEKGLLRGYDDLHPLAIVSQYQISFHSNYPIRTPQDIRGKKIRTAGKIQHELIEALGGTPVMIPIPKAAESLSRGVIQAVATEPLAATAFRIDDVGRNHTFLPFGTVAIMASMSKKKYESLPADAKAILDKYAGETLVRRWGNQNNKSTEQIIERWKNDPKHNVIMLSDKEIQQWKPLFAPVFESWKRENPKSAELLKTYTEEVARVRIEQ